MLADDLGWSDVSWHNEEMKTPHLQELADTGVTLDQSYFHPKERLRNNRVIMKEKLFLFLFFYFPVNLFSNLCQVFSVPGGPADWLLPPPSGPAEVRSGQVPSLRPGHSVRPPASVPGTGRIPQSHGRQVAPR